MTEYHDATGMAKNVATVIGVLAGGMYFAWRVFFQRTFQRLSVEVNVIPLDLQPGAQNRQVVVECSIENKGEARIDLVHLQYKVGPPAGTDRWEDFPANIERDKSDVKYAIDAQSCAHFSKKVGVPPNTQAVEVFVKFLPKLSGETYRAEKVVVIGQQVTPDHKLDVEGPIGVASMEVHNEEYKGLRIAVYKTGDRFQCCVFTGAFGYHVIEQFTGQTGLPPTRLFSSKDDAVAHAKAQIDTDKLRP